MNVTYLHHSSYLLELSTCTILFDPVNITLPAIRKDIPLYVLVSHVHGDHYDSAIFEYQKAFPNICYIVSDDITTHKKQNLIFVKPNQTYDIKDLHISTLTSTDEGVAFLVEVENQLFYFAGDLNWWDWGAEDTFQEAQLMKEAYEKEMRKLTGKQFTAAFIPIDARLKEGYWKGVALFTKYAEASYIFPMHFWEDFSIIEQAKLHPNIKDVADKIVLLHHDNESFAFDL